MLDAHLYFGYACDPWPHITSVCYRDVIEMFYWDILCNDKQQFNVFFLAHRQEKIWIFYLELWIRARTESLNVHYIIRHKINEIWHSLIHIPIDLKQTFLIWCLSLQKYSTSSSTNWLKNKLMQKKLEALESLFCFLSCNKHFCSLNLAHKWA